MEESTLDLDSLLQLIETIMEKMDPGELSAIYSLIETEKLQHLILEMLGAGEGESYFHELDSVTAMLQVALQQLQDGGRKGDDGG